MRELTGTAAIREGLAQAMHGDSRVVAIGEGVPDPRGIFGTMVGLQDEFGRERVFDMPVSESGMTGVCIGASMSGLRLVMTHQRVDFALYALDQIINNAAKWHFMFGGKAAVPLVIRLIIGRGWGQGAQHSQNLAAVFAHIPGLKVVVPSSPFDMKGLLLASIEDNNPVIFLEHRWLHGMRGHVPEGPYSVPLGVAERIQAGADVTVVAYSYATLEARRAADVLLDAGVSVDVIDLKTLKPLDTDLILESVRKTGRLVVVDHAWQFGGVAGEILAQVTTQAFTDLKTAPVRLTLPDVPTPSAPALTRDYYPTWREIAIACLRMVDRQADAERYGKQWQIEAARVPHDVPDPSFTGPF